MATLLDQPYTSRQATYDLRRLRRKGLIERQPHSHRYQLTARGRRVAVLFTKTYGRVLAPGLTAFDPALPADLAKRSPLATAWRTSTANSTTTSTTGSPPPELKLDLIKNYVLAKLKLVS